MSQTQVASTTAGSLPPGPRLPAWVQFGLAWKRPTRSLLTSRQRFGKRYTIKLPFQPPIVVLSDPDDIKELFQAAPEAIHPGEGARILEPVLGRYSLILLDEDIHLEHRRLLLPAFHGERMKALAGLMSELTERELSQWPTDQPVEIHPYVQRLTLEIILRAVFGLEQGERLDALRSSVTAVLKIAESPVSLMLPTFTRYMPWLPIMRRLRRLLAETDALIYAQVHERRHALLTGSDPDAPDVLSMLLTARHEDHSPMSDQEIRDELMTALVAGHETTASQLAWTFAHLARDRRVVDKLREERQEGTGDAYLTATLNEIQRLSPVVPNAEPRLTLAPITIGGHTYPAGVSLLAAAYLVHHDPEIYPDPFAFEPERFLGVAPGTYTWIAFGGGRRRCLGAAFATQEMKIAVAAAIERFDIEPGQAAPEVARRRSITISPIAGGNVILRRRQQNERPSLAGLAPTTSLPQIPEAA
jgi:hypothetical protein